MEMYGLVFACLKFAAVGIVLSATFALLPKLRRFVLPAAIVPASSYFLLIVFGWWMLDNSPICGPNPEWDRCPSHLAHTAMLSAWVAGTIFTFFAAMFVQKMIVLTYQNFANRKQPLNIVEKSRRM